MWRDRTILGILAIVLLSCDGDATRPADPAALLPASDEAPEGVVGEVLAEPVAVRVVDQAGAPVAGVRVDWAVSSGGGAITPLAPTTDADGRAEARWTLGTAAGEQTVSATVAGLEAVVLTAMALAGPVTTLEVVSPAGHYMAIPGSTLWLRPGAVDRFDNPVPGEVVTWESSDPTVAVVDGGVVTGVASGAAEIVARAGGVADTAMVTVEPLELAVVAAGEEHTCGLTADGRAYCWGHGTYGSLGNRDAPAIAVTEPVPVPVLTTERFTSLTAAGRHNCALTGEGKAYCWGDDWHGQLGIGQAPTTCYGLDCAPVPVAVAGGRAFASIAAGRWHTCGVATNGVAYCWGKNRTGQLGVGDQTDRSVPVPVSGGYSWTAVAPQYQTTCGLTTAGEAYCWGGVGRTTPVPVETDVAFETLDAGFNHVCALTGDGVAYCWGGNQTAQLGIGHAANVAEPTAVRGGHTFSSIATSGFVADQLGATCAVATDGTGYCWGYGRMLGAGEPRGNCIGVPCVAEPEPVADVAGFRAITVGGGHACGIGTDGRTYCWGWNRFDRVGITTDCEPHGFCLRPQLVAGQQ